MNRRPMWLAGAATAVLTLYAATALAVPPGWTKEFVGSTRSAVAPRRVHATMLDGKPTVFFFNWEGANNVVEAQRQDNGTWTANTVIFGVSPQIPNAMDYAMIGATPWLAVGGGGQVALYAKEGGAWTPQYVKNIGGEATTPYGMSIALADNGGEPVAVYAGPYPLQYSRYVNFLSHENGIWTETTLATHNSGVSGYDIATRSGTIWITASVYSDGTFFYENTNGTWTGNRVSSEMNGNAILADWNGNPTFFTGNGRSSSFPPPDPSVIYTRDEDRQWDSMIVAALSRPIGSDYKIINGSPTVVYKEPGNYPAPTLLHLAVFDGQEWQDTVLDSSSYEYQQELSLMNFNGFPAVAAYDASTHNVYFYYVPEPTTLSLLALGGIVIIRSRRGGDR